jgi:hypothetical protein
MRINSKVTIAEFRQYGAEAVENETDEKPHKPGNIPP